MAATECRRHPDSLSAAYQSAGLLAPPASGQLALSANSITLGNNYGGNLNSFRFYDWSAPNLVEFADFSGQDIISISANQNITVKSLGNLGSLQSGSSLKILRVAVIAGDSRQFVSVISQEAYKEIGAQYNDSANNNAPAIAYQNLLNPNAQVASNNPLSFFMSSAQAAPWSSWADAWDTVKSVGSFLIPYEDFVMLGKQMYYLATQDWENFDSTQLAFSALGVATVIPILKPLKPLLNPLKSFMRKYGNKPIIKSIAGVLGTATQKAVKGDTSKLLSLLPFMLIVAELATDPDALEGLEFLVDSIESEDDLWAWMEYFNLPDDGWDGDTVPELEFASFEPLPNSLEDYLADPAGAIKHELATIKPLGWFVPVSHAAGGKMVSALKIKSLLKALKQLSARIALKGGKNVTQALRDVVSSLKNTDLSSIRKVAFDPRVLSAIVAAGGNAARKVIRKAKQMRMSPLTMLAVITYLETRRGSCGDLALCKPFNSQVDSRIDGLYSRAFAEVVTGEKDFIRGNIENGAMFHLALLALKHLEYEVSGRAEDKVIATEYSVDLQFYYLDKKVNQAKKWGGIFGRDVDIILAGDGGSSPDEDSIWVEAKSYKYVPSYKSFWKPWNMSKSTYSNHRQFYLDRVATTDNTLPGIPATFQLAEEYQWWVQDWKKKTVRGYTNVEMTEVHKKLRELPKVQGTNANWASLGYSSGKGNSSFTQANVSSRVKLLNVKNWITTTAKDHLLDGIDASLITELITDFDTL